LHISGEGEVGLKKLFSFLSVLILAVGFWVVFALWTGIYSLYTYPPSKEHPDGATLLVSRETGEPVFNSPDFMQALDPLSRESKQRPEHIRRRKTSVHERIIIALPYVDWAYRKSLEPQETD
jgi:hypothetical protein